MHDKCETELVHNTANFILILEERGVYFKEPGIVDSVFHYKMSEYNHSFGIHDKSN
jgi:hypothetical protein